MEKPHPTRCGFSAFRAKGLHGPGISATVPTVGRTACGTPSIGYTIAMTERDDEKRPAPEALLRLCREEEAEEGRGKLKIFLGYAAGVGKTYAMLEEAWQRKLDERDVVAA